MFFFIFSLIGEFSGKRKNEYADRTEFRDEFDRFYASNQSAALEVVFNITIFKDHHSFHLVNFKIDDLLEINSISGAKLYRNQPQGNVNNISIIKKIN